MIIIKRLLHSPIIKDFVVCYNAVGKLVKSIEFPSEGNNMINLEGFDNEVYIVSVVSNNGKIENKKLIKQ
ncbi:MAG: T9SS type A sorting domain-containing protein [Vicingaceae bacterium]